MGLGNDKGKDQCSLVEAVQHCLPADQCGFAPEVAKFEFREEDTRLRSQQSGQAIESHNAVALRNPVARALRRELEWSDPTVQGQVSCLLRDASAHPRRTAFEKAIETDSQSATFDACMAMTWIMLNDDELRVRLLRIVMQSEVARSFTFLATERILRDD
jgi:hypothetical protein